MDSKKYRIRGPCFYLDEHKALVAVPLGTIVEVREVMGAVLMRWEDGKAARREQYYTPEIWQRHVSKHIEPVAK